MNLLRIPLFVFSVPDHSQAIVRLLRRPTHDILDTRLLFFNLDCGDFLVSVLLPVRVFGATNLPTDVPGVLGLTNLSISLIAAIDTTTVLLIRMCLSSNG
jgi:hypothetical protein